MRRRYSSINISCVSCLQKEIFVENELEGICWTECKSGLSEGFESGSVDLTLTDQSSSFKWIEGGDTDLWGTGTRLGIRSFKV